MPTSLKMLVTGATGKTGGAVVTQLLAKGYPVRATFRVQDARSDLLQRRGGEVVVADIFDLPGDKSRDLRQGARAARAADAASRARRCRLDGEPRYRGLGGGA